MQEKLVSQNKIASLIKSHPVYKEIAGGFSIGIRKFCISKLPIGIKDFLFDLLSDLFGGSFIVTFNKNVSHFVIDKKSSYSEVLQLLNDLSFQRVSDLDNPRTFILKGDSIFINNPIYSNLIRIDFWGDKIEEISFISDLSFKRIEIVNTIILSNEDVSLINEGRSFSGVVIVEDGNSPDFEFDFTDIFPLHSNLNLFEKEINSLRNQSFQIYVSTNHQERLCEITENIQFTNESFVEGWKSESLKTVLFTDSELFDSVINKGNNDFLNLQNIEVGDYVVHKNHGVAKYGGLKVVEINGVKSEYLTLNYADQDKIYVPRESLGYVTKYVGTGKNPKLTRLGTQEWEKIQKRIKKSLENITVELLRLYAAREVKKGFAFSKNDETVDKFVSEFPYKETEDQRKAWEEIRLDMESDKPMDRLIVGDVGFGKTELGVRAAFKAIQDGKQVAILAPTTVLVEQHYAVLKERMKNYPVNIEVLSRFKNASELADTVERIKKGLIDIVVGTHRLLSSDVNFNNLGLLIVDEEQRFGVKQKEKLKIVRENVDVLSLSATPIPRSLNMALSGIKDISILLEPPSGRLSVKTYLEEFNWKRIVDALRREKDRKGQSYFVHNNVKTIDTFVSDLRKMAPDLKFTIGHGQMVSENLSKVIREFHEKKYDVLVCTTIIENGIDMPNVNTIIINDSQFFGLSQLHQLRGRVGRSDRQAYCYLEYPEGSVLDTLASSRLETLVASQELGAGFKIASKDLEFRGAGNLLGKEQSGNISSIGYGLYTQLLKEQIKKLKSSDLK